MAWHVVRTAGTEKDLEPAEAHVEKSVDGADTKRKRRPAQEPKADLGGGGEGDSDDGEAAACVAEAIARHRKLLKAEGAGGQDGAAAARPKARDGRPKQANAEDRRKRKAPKDEEEDGEAEEKRSKGDKQWRVAVIEDSAAEAKRRDVAEREARNKELRRKGKMTRKEKYKASKAAKKAEKQNQKPGGSTGMTIGFPGKRNEVNPVSRGASNCVGGQRPEKKLEQGVLKAAGMDKLDSRAVDCFLTGLPYMATERHVAQHFASIGPCTVELLRDHETGRPTGKGFATFRSAEHALQAATWSGTTIQNRWINVRLCEVRENGKRKTMGITGEKPPGCMSAVVRCDPAVTEDMVWEFFADCHVSGLSCMSDRDTGEFRGRVFLDFDDTAHVDLAVAKNGELLGGQLCFVRYKIRRPGDAGGAGSVGGGGGGGRIAPHNRAPPVPKPCGKATQFEESDAEEGKQ